MRSARLREAATPAQPDADRLGSRNGKPAGTEGINPVAAISIIVAADHKDATEWVPPDCVKLLVPFEN